MAGPKYTVEQLLRLRDSPLIKKPDNLPSIEQWFDTPADQNQRKSRPQSLKVDEHLAPENHAQRPALFQPRQLTRNSSTAPEDIVLGPPKTSFASASANRNLVRLVETSERSPLPRTDEDGSRPERLNMRDKFFRNRERGDKDSDRQRDRAGNNGRRGGREDHNGWTSGRPRRSFGQEEAERQQRGAIREKDRGLNDGTQHESVDGLEAEETTNGETKGRFEGRWTKQGNPAWAHREVEDRRESVRDRGWRDRDRQGDRDWTRRDRNEKVEREPEWMGDYEPDVKTQIHTQEDFQRWKEQMKASGGQAEERAVRSEEKAPPQEEEPVLLKKADSSMLPAALNKLFGQWGEEKPENAATQGRVPLSRPPNAKPKSSKFAGFFAPKEDPAPKQPEPPAVSASTAASPSGLSEDREGFQRILQMLGGSTISSKPSKQEGASPQQSRPLSLDAKSDNPLANLFLSGQGTGIRPSGGPIPEQSRQSGQGAGLILPMFNDAFTQGSSTAHRQLPRENDQHPLGEEQRPQPFQPQGREGTQVPPRPVERSTPLSRDSEFLLKLMQQPRPPSNEPRATQNTPRQPPDPNFSIFLDDKPTKVSGQPQPQPQKPQHMKPKMPPPGFADDLNFGPGRRQSDATQDQMSRQAYPRPPPGLFEDPALQHKLRRHPTDDPARYSQTHGTLGQPSALDNFSPYRTILPQQQDHTIAPPPGFNLAPRNTTIPPGLTGFPDPMPFNPSQRAPPPPNNDPRGGMNMNMNMLRPGHAPPPPPPPPGFGTQHLPPGFPPGIYPQEGSMRRALPQYELFHAGQGVSTADMGRPVGRGALNQQTVQGYAKKAGPGPGGAAWEEYRREFGF